MALAHDSLKSFPVKLKKVLNFNFTIIFPRIQQTYKNNTDDIILSYATFMVSGNLLVILVVTMSRRLRSTTNFFLANLAVADFCVGVFCVMQNLSIYLITRYGSFCLWVMVIKKEFVWSQQPRNCILSEDNIWFMTFFQLSFLLTFLSLSFIVRDRPFDWRSWVFGDFLCKMYQFIHSLSYTASIFILVVICMERYFAIIHPITCKQILTSTRLRVSSIIQYSRIKQWT